MCSSQREVRLCLGWCMRLFHSQCMICVVWGTVAPKWSPDIVLIKIFSMLNILGIFQKCLVHYLSHDKSRRYVEIKCGMWKVKLICHGISQTIYVYIICLRATLSFLPSAFSSLLIYSSYLLVSTTKMSTSETFKRRSNPC